MQAKGQDGEVDKDSPPVYRTLNPLDFILMKEEYIRKNPPPPKKEFIKVGNMLCTGRNNIKVYAL